LVLRGGVPIHVNGVVVGAVGLAGLSKEIDAEIANIAATALSPSRMTAQRRKRSYFRSGHFLAWAGAWRASALALLSQRSALVHAQR
jgi:hypothetical protein